MSSAVSVAPASATQRSVAAGSAPASTSASPSAGSAAATFVGSNHTWRSPPSPAMSSVMRTTGVPPASTSSRVSSSSSSSPPPLATTSAASSSVSRSRRDGSYPWGSAPEGTRASTANEPSQATMPTMSAQMPVVATTCGRSPSSEPPASLPQAAAAGTAANANAAPSATPLRLRTILIRYTLRSVMTNVRPAPMPAHPAPDDVLARAVDVCVHYGPVVALAPTSIAIRRGTATALVGPNGSGKSTLLGLLAGLIRPTDGEVVLAPGARVAFVAQQQHHHRWMPLSVEDVLRMGRFGRRGLLGRLGADDRAAVSAAARRLDVAGLRRRPFGELSGGQRQRVLVAQALASEPDLLLLDEPITGLDLPSQQRILDLIDEVTAAG